MSGQPDLSPPRPRQGRRAARGGGRRAQKPWAQPQLVQELAARDCGRAFPRRREPPVSASRELMRGRNGEASRVSSVPLLELPRPCSSSSLRPPPSLPDAAPPRCWVTLNPPWCCTCDSGAIFHRRARCSGNTGRKASPPQDRGSASQEGHHRAELK